MTAIAALAARHAMPGPAAVVVAHPDDEAIGIGGLLPLLHNAVVVHMTDGAAGYGTAAQRRQETAAALQASGSAARHIMLNAPDGQAARHAASLTRQIHDMLRNRQVRLVFTHAYEGGHPDHDTTALVVRNAVRGLPWTVEVIDMAFYHAGPGAIWQTGCFHGDPGQAIPLTTPEQVRKQAMFACHASQAAVLARFPTDRECFRPTPDQDFTRPPHEGALLYEREGWSSFAEWRAMLC